MKDRTHDETMAELFREDPAFAGQYLKRMRKDGDQPDLQVALRQIAKALSPHRVFRAIRRRP